MILGLSNPFISWQFSQTGEVIFSNWCEQEPDLENAHANLNLENECWETSIEDEQHYFICESKKLLLTWLY